MAGSLLKKLTLFLLISIIIALIGFLALPFLIDRMVLPSMLAKTPFSFSRASMSRITPYLVEGSVEMHDGSSPVISIPRFQIRFTPQSLLKRKISTLVLDHATLHFRRENGRLVLPGFKPQTSTGDSLPADKFFLLPLGVESLILDQCLIVIHETGRSSLHIGVSGQLSPTFNTNDTNHRLEALNGSFILSDDISAAVSARARLDDEEIALEVKIDNGVFTLPNGFLGDRFTLPRFKSLSAELELVADASAFSLKHYKLDGTITGLRYNDGKISFSGGLEDKPLNFALSGTHDTHTYRLATIFFESPTNLRVNIAGKVLYRGGQAKTSGSASATWLNPGFTETGTIPLSLSYDAIWSESSGATLVIEGSCDSDLDLALAEGWSLSGLDGLHFTGTLESTSQQLQADLRLASGPLHVHRDFLQLMTSDLDLNVRLTSSSDQIEARITTLLKEIRLPDKELSVKNIVLDIPISPDSSSVTKHPGKVSIETVEMQDEQFFSLAANLENRGFDYTFEGALEMLGGADLKIPFKGHVDGPSQTGSLTWTLVTDKIGPGILPSFLSLPADLDFSGRLEAQGSIDYDRTIEAQARATLVDTRIDFNNVAIEDLDCTIEFPELPRLRSSPSQRCTAAAIDFSTLYFSDVSLTYRVENPQTLFIERSKLNWCGGTLESGSLRLSSQTPELDTTFFCSRIGLAELLDQFGFKGTEGEGSLNGRLPVKLSRQRLDFDDGFLFSTPGTGGIVRFSDTDLLRQGVGAVSEAGFLNYTLQALEDFTYNWTKLSFDSTGDDLLLTLELDGKPSTALPFKFDKKGMLVESDQGQGLQYPIRLDVNFRVPLVDLFQIGQSINTIMGSGQ
ncbi:MAG: hypothetical protein EX260_01675 [Desulfobulbaceae bacterium]|nr:MAG: hypothetical protein EX260_01675 [Desulfobulbaceae bacterium]